MALQILKKTVTFLIQVNTVMPVVFLAFEPCKGYWKNVSVTYVITITCSCLEMSNFMSKKIHT